MLHLKNVSVEYGNLEIIRMIIIIRKRLLNFKVLLRIFILQLDKIYQRCNRKLGIRYLDR